jgi:hypothetical protein
MDYQASSGNDAAACGGAYGGMQRTTAETTRSELRRGSSVDCGGVRRGVRCGCVRRRAANDDGGDVQRTTAETTRSERRRGSSGDGGNVRRRRRRAEGVWWRHEVEEEKQWPRVM